MTEERRRDYPKMLELLADIKTETVDSRIETKRIATLVEERNLSAMAWRGDVCKKFDKIFKWLEELPCKERKLNTKLLWGAVGLIGGIMIAHLGWR